MTSCKHCGSSRVKTRALTDKDLSELGIPVRVSNGASIVKCEKCGEEDALIASMNELIAAAAISLAFAPYKLNSDEVLFCRKAMGFTGKKLAKILDVKPETVSRWENGKQPIADSTEKLFRQHVVLALREHTVRLKSKSIDSIVTLLLSPVRHEADIPSLRYGNDHECELEQGAISSDAFGENGYDILQTAAR